MAGGRRTTGDLWASRRRPAGARSPTYGGACRGPLVRPGVTPRRVARRGPRSPSPAARARLCPDGAPARAVRRGRAVVTARAAPRQSGATRGPARPQQQWPAVFARSLCGGGALGHALASAGAPGGPPPAGQPPSPRGPPDGGPTLARAGRPGGALRGRVLAPRRVGPPWGRVGRGERPADRRAEHHPRGGGPGAAPTRGPLSDRARCCAAAAARQPQRGPQDVGAPLDGVPARLAPAGARGVAGAPRVPGAGGLAARRGRQAAPSSCWGAGASPAGARSHHQRRRGCGHNGTAGPSGQDQPAAKKGPRGGQGAGWPLDESLLTLQRHLFLTS